MAEGLTLIAGKPRSLVARDIRRFMFLMPGGVTIRDIISSIGMSRKSGYEIAGLVGDLVRDNSLEVYGATILGDAWRYRLSVSAWLQMAWARQGEAECVGA